MTDEQKLNMLRAICGYDSEGMADSSLKVYLEIAKDAIMGKLHKIHHSADDAWETRFDTLQVEIANDLIAKIGAEGQTSHSENGINRQWASSYVSPELLRRVVPYAVALGGSSS